MAVLIIINMVLLVFIASWTIDLDTKLDQYEKTQKQLLREINDLLWRDLL